MPIGRARPRMKRTQVMLASDDLEALRSIAKRKRTSLSKLIRSALKAQIEEERSTRETVDMWEIVAMGEGTDPRGSERHDETLYGG